MEEVPEYYFNITYFEKNALLQIKCIGPVKYGEHGVPDFKVLGKESEGITKEILDIERRLPEGQRYLMSIKDGGFSTKIASKKTLKELCDMLNKERGEEIFNLAT